MEPADGLQRRLLAAVRPALVTTCLCSRNVVQSGMAFRRTAFGVLMLGTLIAPLVEAEPRVLPKMPSATMPVGAIDVSCPVSTKLEATMRGTRLVLTTSLVNRTGEPVEVPLRNRCPVGSVRVTGLPAGMDPTQSCNKGPCLAPDGTQTVTVPARESIVLATMELDANGDTCNQRLPAGSFALAAEVESSPAWLACRGVGVRIARDGPRGPLRIVAPGEPASDEVLVTPTPARKPPPVVRKPAKPAPRVKTVQKVRKRPCPACGIGCLDGVPLQGTGPDGCPRCGCENLRATIGQ